MKKLEQRCINDTVKTIYDDCIAQFLDERFNYLMDKKRLRSCTAWVYETSEYYVLQSYGTVVACILKSNDTCFDFLRYVYGYTPTSAQHIAKFRHDYGKGKWGCEYELRYYPV